MPVFLKSRLLIIYVTIAIAIITTISVLQYNRYSLYGTNLLLGWDSSRYVWVAQEIITKGPVYTTSIRSYPHFYIQLLAFLGYVAGNIAIVERILPLVFCTLLIFANAKITLKITKNIHIAGLAAILTSLSINTLRLFADLNRNLMALSLGFTAFLLISNFIDQKTINKKSLRSKTYLSIMALFLIIAGTQFETFFVLAISIILLGVSTRNAKKLTALTLIPAIPTAVLLAMFPNLPQIYLKQIGFARPELTLGEILLWSGGSWLLLSFLTAGAIYLSYRAIRQRNTMASIIFFYTAVITAAVILTTQKIIPINAEYALRALFILPIPLLFASAIHASATLLKGVFIEIGVSSPAKRRALKISVKHVAVTTIVLILIASSTTTTFQHYNEFLTPYIPEIGYQKITTAIQYLKENSLRKPIVVLYGEHASWFSDLYNNYIGAEIGEHYNYHGNINNLLYIRTDRPQSTRFLVPILIITPYLYDKEIPYYITPYHISQGVYIIPPNSTINQITDFGPSVAMTTDLDIQEIKSEYIYADQNDPATIVLRVTTKGYTTYTLENYPQNWAFLKLEQGDALSFRENNPQRFNGTKAIEGNDPTESIQYWSTLQAATISIISSSGKEGYANMRIDGTTDSWGNLGARYNAPGTWNLTSQSSMAVWARANEETTFSIGLTDSAGNTRTYWNIQPDGSSATPQWKRFVVSLNSYHSQSPDFDLSKVDSVDFYVYSTSGRTMTLWIDDPVIDNVSPTSRTVHKARVLQKDPIIVYFTVKMN